ncbi:MAG TPA: aminotransferase [Myxococcota bacterium]|nr:aminotransferase [Myxococcota bacterium]
MSANRAAGLEIAGAGRETEAIQAQDNRFIHPWENLKNLGRNKRNVLTRAEGIYVYDSEGNRYIDGPAGMWCVNVGYGRREIADAVGRQLLEMPYDNPWAFTSVPAARLAERLTALTPGDLKHVFFTTSGSLSVDSALRFVLFYNTILGRPEKRHIISRQDAYHGSTYLGASCSGKERDKTYQVFEKGFVHHLPSPNPYRRPEGMSVDAFCAEKVADLENKILELGPHNVAAFIAEPILASGGVVVPPPGYQKKTLEVCRRYDVLYISDEVVTGFGRCGEIFASEPVFEIVPDIITAAKGISSGYVPLGAVFISDRLIREAGEAGSPHSVFANGFTYSGHPAACAAGLATLDIIEREHILEHVREIAPYFQARWQELRDIPLVGDVRGVGLMACVECKIDARAEDALKLDYEVGARVDRYCQELGLILRPFINMCIVSPPCTITRAQIDEMVRILRTGIEKAMQDLRREGLFSN